MIQTCDSDVLAPNPDTGLVRGAHASTPHQVVYEGLWRVGKPAKLLNRSSSTMSSSMTLTRRASSVFSSYRRSPSQVRGMRDGSQSGDGDGVWMDTTVSHSLVSHSLTHPPALTQVSDRRSSSRDSDIGESSSRDSDIGSPPTQINLNVVTPARDSDGDAPRGAR